MFKQFLLALLSLPLVICVSGEPEEDFTFESGKKPWIVTQDSGLANGSFVPRRQGINLPANPKIMVIPVNNDTTNDGMIDQWQANFIRRRLKVAEQDKFDLVVLEIDSPGGNVLVVKEIVDALLKCKVPTVAFVRQKALSGGAILALACKMVVMEPHSEMGSAKAYTPLGDLSTALRQKLDSDMRAIMRNLSEANGYPYALAEGMVDSAMEVIETRDTKRRFMTGEEFQVESKRGATQVKIWKSKDQILTLTAQEARNAGVASGLANDMNEVALGLGVPNAQIVRMEISSAESAARFLSGWWWRVLAVVLGLIALLIELKSPGHGVGYGTFALCMGIFFWLQFFSNTAGMYELLLFGLGAVLLAVELFILPSVGALAFVGITMIVVSIILSFLPEGMIPGLLGFSGKPPDYMMRQAMDGMQWASLTLLSIIGFFTVVWWKGLKLPGVNRFALETVNAATVRSGGGASTALPAIDAGAADTTVRKPPSKLSTLVGMTGAAETTLRPAGKIRLEGATYDAVTEGDFIDPGVAVIVLRAQGSSLVVRAEPSGTGPAL